jgi:hypothetical protein
MSHSRRAEKHIRWFPVAEYRHPNALLVLVWKFDRFAWSVKHLGDSLAEFRALDIDFISCGDSNPRPLPCQIRGKISTTL